jgi:hypothetical protein
MFGDHFTDKKYFTKEMKAFSFCEKMKVL